MNKSIQTLIALSLSLQLIGCAAQQPKPDGDQPNSQASAAPVADLKQPDPENAEELYAYAVKLEELGKDADALSYYLQATQVNPEHLKAHIALAQLYTKGGRKDEALVAYENVLRLDRNHAFVAQYKEARLKYYSAQNIAQNEEYDKALKLLGEAPKGTPMDEQIAAKEKEWQGMLQSGSDVRKTQETIEQASLLAYQGKYQDAIELIKTAPGADTNATVQDKLSQWNKALANQPAVSASVAPPSLNNRKLQYVQGDDVNLRQSPYLYAESLGSLKYGAAVEVLLDKGYEADGYQWSKVRTEDGKVGWVAANLLTASLVKPSASARPTPKPFSPPPSIKPTARPSARPTAHPTQPPMITETPPKSFGTRYIKTDDVNVRRAPSTKSSLVTTLREGAPVILLSDSTVKADGYSWAKVKLSDGQIGWIAASFLRGPSQSPPSVAVKPSAKPSAKPTAKPAVAAPRSAQITGEDVNVRSAPDTAASVVTLVSAPTKVTLLNDKPVRKGNLVWQRIQLPGGKNGWVATQFLGSAKASTTTSNMRRFVRGDNVNVRSKPTTVASVLIRASEGTAVTLLPEAPIKQNGITWVKIRLADGRMGWISKDFLGQ